MSPFTRHHKTVQKWNSPNQHGSSLMSCFNFCLCAAITAIPFSFRTCWLACNQHTTHTFKKSHSPFFIVWSISFSFSLPFVFFFHSFSFPFTLQHYHANNSCCIRPRICSIRISSNIQSRSTWCIWQRPSLRQWWKSWSPRRWSSSAILHRPSIMLRHL